jgi:hypothetical protein
MGLNSERVDFVRTMSPQQPTDKNGPPESGKQLLPIAVADHMNHSLDRLVGNAPRRTSQLNDKVVQQWMSYSWKLYHL